MSAKQLGQISTHALREEGDLLLVVPSVLKITFLPTPSARRATRQHICKDWLGEISTHALREEGDSIHFALQVIIRISTHALREEGDVNSMV